METVTYATTDPPDAVRERLAAGCRERRWSFDPTRRHSVVIEVPSGSRLGVAARFVGELGTDGRTTRLTGAVDAPITGKAAVFAVALGGIAVCCVVGPLVNGTRPGGLCVMSVAALFTGALAAPFAFVARSGGAVWLTALRAGLAEMVGAPATGADPPGP
ncbi:MAG: hypothetical protein ABMB14_31120 [Myxococcota bacterium]